jgi:hypothetical protein
MSEAITESWIKDYITAQVNLHSKRIKEHELDEQYYNDTFKVNIQEPFHVVRTGTAARIVDSIVEHIEVANPQVTRKPQKKTEGAMQSAIKVSRMLNNWILTLSEQMKDAIQNGVLRGEGIFQVEYNPDFNLQEPNSMPIIVSSLDPVYTYCDPYDALIPDRVCKKFGMNVNYVKSAFPEWKPARRLTNTSEVMYEAYWDKEVRYFDVDGVSVSNGVQKNVYGFTPFVHFYAGFGKKSPRGKPEEMAVGRLRKIRGRLKEECEIESRVDSIIGLYANPIRLIRQTQANAEEINRQELESSYIGAGATMVVPYGWEQDLYVPNVPSAQLFQHLYQIRQSLSYDNPGVLSGIASTSESSGRLEDALFSHVEKKYARLISSLERALAVVLGMGLRILETVPDVLPITTRATMVIDGEAIEQEEKITKEDINNYYDCVVKLNPEEALEADRKAMLGRMLVNEGRISWRKFLTDYMGHTEDSADDIIAETLAEQAILTDPTMRQIRVMEAIEQAGMTRYLDKLQQEAGQEPVPPATYRPSEAGNPVSSDILRQVLGETPVGVRRPPTE